MTGRGLCAVAVSATLLAEGHVRAESVSCTCWGAGMDIAVLGSTGLTKDVHAWLELVFNLSPALPLHLFPGTACGLQPVLRSTRAAASCLRR